MNPYYITLFILCVLLVTHPGVRQWIRSRWADVRDVMEENDDE